MTTPSTPIAPKVECEQIHPTLQVADILAAVDFYVQKLGFCQSFIWGDPPSFAGLMLGNVQIFLQKGTPDPRGCGISFMIGDADELYAFHRASGVEIDCPIGDREYGIRDYSVKDLHGYRLSFGHRISMRAPALQIERVDVPVRLEKRLAALLYDLAEYKHMSLSSCLEEILLHTCEPLGDGVASPHTQRDLRHIQQLKKKHGIDYDCHASYGFVEK